MGAVAEMAERMIVMYAGRMAEMGPVAQIIDHARHPYTQGLLESMPRLDETTATKLHAIPGQPPNLQNLPAGCAFQDRCEHCMDPCLSEMPVLKEFAEGRSRACHLEMTK